MGKHGLDYHKILQQATAAVYVENELVGTAWLCNKRYMITAGHLFQKNLCCSVVFNEERDVTQYSKRHVAAEVIFSKNICSSGVDFAILKLQEEIERRWLPLQIDKIEYTNVKVISFGYGKDCPGAAMGKVIGSAYCDSNTKFELIKINSQQLTSYGYSGAAIFDDSSKKVIGIQIEATSEQSRERETVLAYPIYRLYEECKHVEEFISAICDQRSGKSKPKGNINNSNARAIRADWTKDFVENHFLPLLAISILNLHHHDNLDAYVRCIIVKLKRTKRSTVYEAKSSINIPNDIRGRSKIRERNYGVVGIMLRQKVTTFCDFKNKSCYKLSLSGEAQKIEIDFDREAGDQEERIALLVSPIKDAKNNIIGVLSFDFFAQNNSKDIIQVIEEEKSELDRLIFHSTYYAEFISKAIQDKLLNL